MILVCGESLYDLKAGPVSLGGQMLVQAMPGGSPCNIARAMGRQGGNVALFSGISQDIFGQALRQVLSDDGVQTRYLVAKDHQTSLALVSEGSAETDDVSFSFYGYNTADTVVGEMDIPPRMVEFTAIQAGSCSLVQPANMKALDRLIAWHVKGKGRLLALDVNVRPAIQSDMVVWRNRVHDLLPHTGIIKASHQDLICLYPETPVRDVAANWLEAGASMVIVTTGAKGAVAWWGDKALVGKCDVSIDLSNGLNDAVGAGDCFHGSVLTWLQARDLLGRQAIEHMSLEDVGAMLAYANKAAALTCQQQGAVFPDLAALAE